MKLFKPKKCINVESCSRCPYITISGNLCLFNDIFDGLNGKLITVKNNSIIDPDCPLEDNRNNIWDALLVLLMLIWIGVWSIGCL